MDSVNTHGTLRRARWGVPLALLLPLILLFVLGASAPKPPTISVSSPKAGSTQNGVEVQISVKTSNIKLDARGIGAANKAGSGYLTYSVDGVLATKSANTSAKFRSFSPGQHTVTMTHAGPAGTRFYFDFLEVAVPIADLPMAAADPQ
ncbi:MAG: hypothetical protein HY261_00930, partial [Chloroflexi bacterium]|nr:hypothetical protein [Chloroflexota bacterium]